MPSEPNAAMMAPIESVVSFMQTRDRRRLRSAFVRRGVVIVENFVPYVFTGAGAIDRWAVGFERHALALSDLRARFGAARDFAATADRSYFCLPTTWTGREAGRPFVEHGAWVFVLTRDRSAWQILAYAWGVTSASHGSSTARRALRVAAGMDGAHNSGTGQGENPGSKKRPRPRG